MQMKHAQFCFVLFVLLIAAEAQADKVFNNKEASVSFRYPASWHDEKPQLASVLTLLYADDGTNATCNFSARKQSVLSGADEKKMSYARKVSHKRGFYERMIKKFDNASITSYWRGRMGQLDSGCATYTQKMHIDDTKTITLMNYICSTIENEMRYTLVCNGETDDDLRSAKQAFEHIKSTMLFVY